MSKLVNTDGEYLGGFAAHDLILDIDSWNDGYLYLTFGQTINGKLKASYIDAIITETVVLELTDRIRDYVTEQFSNDDKNNVTLGAEKLITDAYGEAGDLSVTVNAGEDVSIFSIACNYKLRDGSLGSLDDPVAMIVPLKTGSQIGATPISSKKIHIDWLAVAGSDRDITDITAAQLAQRLYNEKMFGHDSRRIYF